MRLHQLGLGLFAVFCGWSFSGFATASAGDVVVKGVHLCCGSCVAGVNDALSDVKGVSKVAGDQNTKVVSFQVTDEKVAAAALAALAKGGFHGTATHDKKAIEFPSTKVEKGTKSDRITVTGVHLCCGACVTGVKKGLEKVTGVQEIKIDREDKTVTVGGTDIDVAGFFEALYAAGYHGELKK